MDLYVFLLGETLDRLSESPDTTIVVSELGDKLVRVLREILYDDCL